jgi:Family of unknown function (DUF6252)
MKLISSSVILFFCFALLSCNSNRQESNANENAAAVLSDTLNAASIGDTARIISKQQFDSLMAEGKLAARQNIAAMVDGEKFISTSFTVNDMDLKGTIVYAIYATNGMERIIINYRGKPEAGTYDLVQNADAIYMTADNKLYNAVKGTLTFSQFDVEKKIISGTFSFLAEGDNEKRKQINITGGSFSDLEFY